MLSTVPDTCYALNREWYFHFPRSVVRVLGRDNNFWFEEPGRASQGGGVVLSLALKAGYDLDR